MHSLDLDRDFGFEIGPLCAPGANGVARPRGARAAPDLRRT
jgi:hypothetical protein